MQRQQFVHRPAMVCDPAAMAGVVLCAWDKVRSTKAIHCAHHKHPSCRVRCGVPARHRARQRCEAFPERRVQPLNVRCIDHAVSLRPTQEGLHACRRAIDNAAFGRDHMPPLVVFDDLGDQDMAPRTKPWPSAHAHVHGIAKRLPHGADVGRHPVQIKRGRHAAQRLTRLLSRRIRGMSRCALTSPPSHKRVLTIIASAIHTTPLCFLTRSSSACTCPKSRGCSTRTRARPAPVDRTGPPRGDRPPRQTQKPPQSLAGDTHGRARSR